MDFYMINRPEVICEELDGETVVINLESGCYYSLDLSASYIWQALDNGMSTSDICEKICEDTGIKKETLESDVSGLLSYMLNEDLIKPCLESDLPGPIKVMNKYDLVYSYPVIEKHADIKEMLILDPIHEVEDVGWPVRKKDPEK